MSSERQAAIVISDKFASRLKNLVGSRHVWALQTSATEEVACQIWEKHPPQNVESLTSGITLFSGVGDPEHDLLSIIDTVELHHGNSGGQVPPVGTINVFGTEPTDAVREAFGSLGFSRLVPCPEGFVAYRDPS
jgi:hypothetical protein